MKTMRIKKKLIQTWLIFIFINTTACNLSPNKNIKNGFSVDPIVIPFKTMTFSYKGDTRPVGENGELIFEKERIIIKSGKSKEWFKINSIKEESQLLTFVTNNSQNESAVFIVNFTNGKLDYIKNKIFDGLVNFQVLINNITRAAFADFYSELLVRDHQPEYIETKRDDGLISKMYEPQIVADDGGMQIALSFLKSQAGNYVSVILRFEKKMRMLNGKMALRLSNDELLRFEPEKFQKSNIGNYDAVLGLFKCPDNYIEMLKIWKVTNISLSFSDGSLNTYSVEANGDVLTKQIKLLK